MTHKRITSRVDLIGLARDLRVRPDWHEPDEQELDVVVKGQSFDNSGFWGPDQDVPEDASYREVSVILRVDGEPVAEVNLADLFSWACGTND